MNFFFLDLNPETNAKYYYNKHVIKIILEVAQMLYCAHWTLKKNENDWPVDFEPYKATHKNHPMTMWVRSSRENYDTMCRFGMALCKEYTHRYGKIHACEKHLKWLQEHNQLGFRLERSPNSTYAIHDNPQDCTPLPLCMPKEFHFGSLLASYRLYYLVGKRHIRDKRSDDQVPLQSITKIWSLKGVFHTYLGRVY